VQIISGYLYNQTLDLIINLDPLPNRENQLVYAKPLQIFKGIDNKIKLLIKNQDQKLQSLSDTSIIFNLVDSATRELIFTRRVVPITDKRGSAYVTLDRMDVDELPAGIYNYSVQLISGEGEYNIVYADDNYNAQGQARVNDGVYPVFQPSLQPNLGPFYNNNPNFAGYSDGTYAYSDVLNVFDRVKARDVQQTVQYNVTDFLGSVVIEGSLSSTLTAYPDDWFYITEIDFIHNSGCYSQNFNGKFGLIRFKIQTTDGTLDKILYRP
jgi:hypothetical protein